MSSRSRHASAVAASLLSLALSGASDLQDADADDDDDHVMARDALEKGEVLPLVKILQIVEKTIEGELVGMDFDYEHEAWIYELEYVTRDGRFLEVEVDAATGRILEIEDD